MEEVPEIREHSPVVRRLGDDSREAAVELGDVAGDDGVDEPGDDGAVNRPQHAVHDLRRDIAASKSDCLVGKAQRVTHASPCRNGKVPYRRILGGDVLRLQDLLELARDLIDAQGAEPELYAAREYGYGELLRISRRQDELHVLGRLLKGLQESVEAALREHVHLVDEVDLVPPLGRLVLHVLEDFPGVVHLGP